MKTFFSTIYKFIILFTFIVSTPIYSGDRREANRDSMEYLYYSRSSFGSVSLFNPIFVTINGAYGTMQAANRDKNPFRYDYKTGYKNLIYNLSHPLDRINEYGWKGFITQIVPTGFDRSVAQFYPNWQLHFVGGGMIYRETAEWYHYHGFKYPFVWSAVTMAAYHFLTEVVENDTYVGTNVDPIADLYVFDLGGVVLFSFEPVAKFFANTLNLSDWSYIPMYNPVLKTFENNGQNFSIKYKLPKYDRWSILFYFGLHGMVGLSYTTDRGKTFSFAGGAMTTKIVKTDPQNPNDYTQTVNLGWNVGFFYDIDNSLMTSLVIALSKRYKVRLNVYPGVFSFGKISPGFFAAVGARNEVYFGITFNFLPIGLAYQYPSFDYGDMQEFKFR